MINYNNREEQPPRAENIEHGSEDTFSNFAERSQGVGGENRSLGERLRPSEETVRVGERFLDEDIYNRITSVYERVFDKIPENEKTGIPQGAGKNAKAVFVKEFLNNNSSRRNSIIEGLSDSDKEDYFRVTDLGEIRGGLKQGQMKIETSFLLYDYLHKRYNTLVEEQNRAGESSDSSREADINQLFTALKELTEKLKLDGDTVDGRAMQQMSESRGDYIDSRRNIEANLQEGKRRVEEAIIQKKFERVPEDRRSDYGDISEFANRSLDNFREALRGVPVNLTDDNIYALMRRFNTEDINIKKGFFGRARDVKIGYRLIPVCEFASFVATETRAFARDVENMTSKILGEAWDSDFKGNQEREIFSDFPTLNAEQIRNTCNNIRRERMQKFWEKELKSSDAQNEVESARERYDREGDWVNVVELLNSLTGRKFSGNLEDDANEIMMALKTAKVINKNYLDKESMIELVRNRGGKDLSDKSYSKTVESKRERATYIFRLIDFLSKENEKAERNTGYLADIIEDLKNNNRTDEIDEIKSLINFYEAEKPECLAKVANALYQLDDLRERGELSGDIIKDSKKIFTVFKGESFFEKNSPFKEEKNLTTFVRKLMRDKIISKEDYSITIKNKENFYVFMIDLVNLIEKKQQ